MFQRGLVPSGESTWLECTAKAPAPLVQNTRIRSGAHGRQCAGLAPGWWLCREWN